MIESKPAQAGIAALHYTGVDALSTALTFVKLYGISGSIGKWLSRLLLIVGSIVNRAV